MQTEDEASVMNGMSRGANFAAEWHSKLTPAAPKVTR
jgi:hypothetical protein